MTPEKLRILVVDDKWEQRQAAEDQLGNYQLSLAGSYEDALKALLGMPPYGKGYTEKTGGVDDFLQAKQKCVTEAVSAPYDVVLTDLFMPTSKLMLGPDAIKEFSAWEMPYGFPIAMLALQRGVPYVALNSDTNHHHHPLAFAMEMLTGMDCLHRYRPSGNEWTQYQNWHGLIDLGKSRIFVTSSTQIENKEKKVVKDWALTLQHVLEDTPAKCIHAYENG